MARHLGRDLSGRKIFILGPSPEEIRVLRGIFRAEVSGAQPDERTNEIINEDGSGAGVEAADAATGLNSDKKYDAIVSNDVLTPDNFGMDENRLAQIIDAACSKTSLQVHANPGAVEHFRAELFVRKGWMTREIMHNDTQVIVMKKKVGGSS